MTRSYSYLLLFPFLMHRTNITRAKKNNIDNIVFLKIILSMFQSNFSSAIFASKSKIYHHYFFEVRLWVIKLHFLVYITEWRIKSNWRAVISFFCIFFYTNKTRSIIGLQLAIATYQTIPSLKCTY